MHQDETALFVSLRIIFRMMSEGYDDPDEGRIEAGRRGWLDIDIDPDTGRQIWKPSQKAYEEFLK